MAFSKMKEFSFREQHLALICQALSHPVRVRLVHRIITGKDNAIDFEDLTKNIPLGTSTISQHLRYLRAKKVIKFGVLKGQSYYMINDSFANLTSSLIHIMAIMKSGVATEIESEVTDIIM